MPTDAIRIDQITVEALGAGSEYPRTVYADQIVVEALVSIPVGAVMAHDPFVIGSDPPGISKNFQSMGHAPFSVGDAPITGLSEILVPDILLDLTPTASIYDFSQTALTILFPVGERKPLTALFPVADRQPLTVYQAVADVSRRMLTVLSAVYNGFDRSVMTILQSVGGSDSERAVLTLTQAVGSAVPLSFPRGSYPGPTVSITESPNPNEPGNPISEKTGSDSWYAWRIVIDGVDVTSMVPEHTVNISRSSVHDTLEFRSPSEKLEQIALPGAVAVVRWAYFFYDDSDNLCETKQQFRFFLRKSNRSGRVRSYFGTALTGHYDLADTPDAESTGEELASVCADSLVSGSVWDVVDWTLPDHYGFIGRPFDGLKQLADAVGAVIRGRHASDSELGTYPDGIVRIERKHEVRPVDLSGPLWIFGQEVIVRDSLSVDKSDGTGHTRIDVDGHSPGTEIPGIAIEETVNRGEAVYLRLYWPENRTTPISAWASDGDVAFLGVDDDEIEDDITIIDGTGNTSKPVKSVISYEWIGSGDSVPAVQSFGTVVTTDDQYGILRLTYYAQYQRYACFKHDVQKLLAVLHNEDSGISIRVIFGNLETSGQKPAPQIINDLLTTDAAAQEAGTVQLDSTRYDKRTVRFQIPFHKSFYGIQDGDIGMIDYPGHTANGIGYITDIRLNQSGFKATAEITMEIPDVR